MPRLSSLLVGATLFLFVFSAHDRLCAQSTVSTPITGYFTELTIVEILQIIENRYDIQVYYIPDRIPYFRVTRTFEKVPLYRVLESIVEGTNLTVVHSNDQVVLLNKTNVNHEAVENILHKWATGEFVKPLTNEAHRISAVFGDSLQVGSKELTFSGVIADTYSGEPIIGALVRTTMGSLSTVTDKTGAFSINISSGRHDLTISYLGYRTIELDLELYDDGALGIEMEVASISLDEVVVESSSAQNNLTETQIGLEVLSVNDIKNLPSFLGEVDILKGLEYLPGVSSVGEASAGFNVRGGNVDQNLVLLDEAVLFNASHALGFFSIFHPDIVQSVALYKGNIPAKYGGRLSSVLAVDLKEGNLTRWQGAGGIGLVSSRIMLEGPIVKGKTAMIAGLRSTYSNWLLRQADSDDVNNSDVYFGDALIKVTHKLGDTHGLSLTGYASHDYFKFSEEFGFSWSTYFGAVNWTMLVSDAVAISTHIVKGSYRSRQFDPDGAEAFNLHNGLDYLKLKSNLSIQGRRQFVNTGIEVVRYSMLPERIEPFDADSQVMKNEVEKDHAIEASLYVDDEFDISPRVSVSLGLRATLFTSFGPRTVYSYSPDAPKREDTVIDSMYFARGESIRSYSGLQPRISVHYKAGNNFSLKWSYNRVRQYVHLISNTTAATPVDLWQLSNYHLTPAQSQNASMGAFWQMRADFEFSVEVFHKWSDHVVEYKDFAQLILNDKLETQVLQGEGRAYGLELLLRKRSGKTSGQIAYTFSRSKIRVRGSYPEERIADGKWFASSFDQPHQLSFQIKRQVNAVHSFQFAFTYRQGRPITPPIGTYALGSVLVTQYAGRNALRIPDYHRLDFGYTIDNSKSKLHGLRSSFSLSFYNLYGRKNAFTVYFQRDKREIQRAYKLALLGTVFPSLTWNLNF